MEYIERETAIARLENLFQLQASTARAIIEAIPAADVAPVRHGKWTHLGGDEWCCDVCGHVISTEGSWENPLLDRGIRFCENCGALMDKEETE